MKAGKKSSSPFIFTDEKFALTLVVPLIIFELVLVAYPFAYSFWLSLNEVLFVRKTFAFIGLGNYLSVFTNPESLHFVLTTVRITIDITVLTILSGLGIALLLNESFKGRTLLRTIVLLPWAVSEYCTGVIWRFLYSEQLGFFNSLLMLSGLINKNLLILTPEWAPEFVSIAFAWHYTPLIAFFLLAGLQTVPEDLYRAARVDGASPIKRFIKVTVPHLKYAILISLILASMEAARATDIIILLTGGGPGIATESLTWHIYKTSFRNLDLGLGAAYSYILLIIMMIIGTSYFYILFGRRKK
ncbi:MAG: carbohydrate ABC transporter permease [Nitrososphaeria archaeon]